MDNPEFSENKNHALKAKSHFSSQLYAINGIKLIFQNERNFRIQLVISLFVIAGGVFFGFSHIEWISVSLLIGMVLIAEAFNSAVEALCDTVSSEYRISIKYAKDVSAGAVSISSLVSFVSGVVIFIPHVIEYIKVMILLF